VLNEIQYKPLLQDDTIYPCPNPCSCPPIAGECTDCGPCPRQLGEPCTEESPCDLLKGLVCRYRHGDSDGVCRGKTLFFLSSIQSFFMFSESSGVPCVVYNRTYEHGETFNLDCRTQCVCQVSCVSITLELPLS